MAGEMVERVARALSQADMAGKRSKGIVSEPMPWRGFIPDARAAIEAMRWVDGYDEDIAIAAGRVIQVDAVMASECHDAWINAALAE